MIHKPLRGYVFREGLFSGTGRPCNEIFCLKGYTSRRGRGRQEKNEKTQ